jgi:hypothetical protein
MVSWADPLRFRRLCPLLRRNPDGEWRCSVNTADVRPFWGRAFAYLGGALVALFLAGTVGAFVFYRAVGYPVSYRSVVWPPAWHEIDRARAKFFLWKAVRAFNQNQPVAGVMALSQSYELDPSNYDVGWALAQTTQQGWADISNGVYRRLLLEHPERSRDTAAAWFKALLARGDFVTIETLAAGRAGTDTAWLQALLVSSRRTGDREPLMRLLRSSQGLPPYVRQVCALELQLRAADGAGMRRLLRQNLPASAEPFLVYYWVDRQLHAGMTDEALATLRRNGPRLDARDRMELFFGAYSAEGWQVILRGEAERMLASGTNTVSVELISAHLIRHPDPVLLERLFAAVYRQPLPANSDLVGMYTSLFCAAGVGGDWMRLEAAAAELRSVTHAQFANLTVAEAFFRGGAQQPTVPLERCLGVLHGLPVDVSYAMYEFADSRAAIRHVAKIDAN